MVFVNASMRFTMHLASIGHLAKCNAGMGFTVHTINLAMLTFQYIFH